VGAIPVVCGLMTGAYRRKTRSSARASITTQRPAHVVRTDGREPGGRRSDGSAAGARGVAITARGPAARGR
jgi:hypothetical protein